MNTGFVVKAWVTKKNDPFQWKNPKGVGELMNIEIIDKQGDQILCTLFNEAVKKFKDVIQVGKCYVFHNGQIKPANKWYTSIKNDY